MDIQVMRVKLVKEQVISYEPIVGQEIAFKVFEDMLKDEAQEVFSMMTLDTKNNITGFFEVHRGSLDKSMVSVREVAKRALLANAAKVIIAHNHPSGDNTPSNNDYHVTEVLAESLAMLEIKLLDSLIIGNTTRSIINDNI